jgi:hypothetical protein
MNENDRDDPLVWLLLLERGRQTGDFDIAARAKRELERLGVFVTYRRPNEREKPRENSTR